MNKTISINLGGRNFFIEEEAYRKLESYLNAIKARFAEYPGSGEIVADMEARIGEKFGEKYEGNSQAVITIADVDSLISELGSAEDIAGEEGKKNESRTSSENSIPKRLMRNGDDKIIAGVCSGIAAYFDIDPIIVRGIFVILIFAWGTIIPIYFVLWLIMPEAKTLTDKMQMRGQAFNLGNISETVKSRAEEFKEHVQSVKTKEEWKKWGQDIKTQAHKVTQDAKDWGKKMEAEVREKNGEPETPKAEPVVEPVVEPAPKTQTMNEQMYSEPKRARGGFGNFLRQVFQGIGRIIWFIIKLFRRVVGLALIIAFALAIAGVTLGFATAIFNANSPYIGLPIAGIPHTAAFYLLLVVAYVIVLIPLQLLLFVAINIFSGRRAALTAGTGFSLFGAWMLALVIGGAVGARYVPQYIEQIKSSPQLQTVSKSFDVKDFNKLQLGSSISYKITQGKDFSVKASGWNMDVNKLYVAVDQGTLHIDHGSGMFCVFCFNGKTNVEITAPDFLDISAENSSSVTAENITATTTSLSLYNSSKANINYVVKNLSLHLGNSSQANLSGTTDSLNAELSNSSNLNAKNLLVNNADVTTANSSEAHINVSQTLKYQTFNSSQIYYLGNPVITTNKGAGYFENPPMPDKQ